MVESVLFSKLYIAIFIFISIFYEWVHNYYYRIFMWFESGLNQEENSCIADVKVHM